MAQMDRTEGTGMHPSQWLALAIGAVYTLVGIAGFFVTGFDNFASQSDEQLLGFAVNPLHNIAHLAVGLLGLMMFKTLATARMYGWVLFGAYALLFVYGLFAVGNDDLQLLNLNAADNVLHLLTALAGLAVALWPATRTSDRGMRATRPV